jgi:hypothetical protein
MEVADNGTYIAQLTPNAVTQKKAVLLDSLLNAYYSLTILERLSHSYTKGSWISQYACIVASISASSEQLLKVILVK